MQPMLRHALLVLLALTFSGCNYLRLARPSVLKQLDSRVVALVNFLPDIDNPNEATVARLIGTGGLAHAELGRDSVMRARIRIPKNELIWKPSVIVVPTAGTVELEFSNEDNILHQAILPSEGSKQFLNIPIHTRGIARLQLDQPGLYSFGCPIANHGGRGMIGLIIVRGEVPPEARLARPRQPRPE